MLALTLEQEYPTRRDHLTMLEETLKTERRLLEDLVAVLGMQRTGVSGDDLAAIDDSVFAAQRVLRTLSEARARHRTLLGILAGRDDLPLGEVEDALGGEMTMGLRTALHELQGSAARLARELERNARLLEGALHTGNQLLDALGGGAKAPVVYGAPGAPPPAERPSLLNRQA